MKLRGVIKRSSFANSSVGIHNFKYRFFRFFKINKNNRSRIWAPIAGVFLIVSLTIFVFSPLFAETVSHTWGTLDTNTVAFDDNIFESDGSSLKLKAQNYANDVNTSALYHFDELGGSVAADSSVNGNSANFNGGAAFAIGNLNNSMDLSSNGSFASTPDSESLTLGGQHTIESWVKFNNQFSTSASQDQGVIDKGSYKVYYDRTSGKINYEIADGNSNTWTRQAGLDLKGSWDQDGKTIVRTSAVYGTDKYVGLGLGTGDAEVWRWNGTVWSIVGGDNVNSSWADLVYEDVNDLVVNGSTLYAGLGTNAAGDAEVWSCNLASNCSDWTKIGGDGVNTSWQINTFESVNDMSFYGGNLYAAIGNSANDAEVWRWNGTAWTKIGGDSLFSGWTINYEAVRYIVNDGTNLYAGLGDSAGDAEVWRWNGTAWLQIGGDGLNSSWLTADNIEYVYSMDYFGGNLYVGNGATAGDADVWRYNGTTWTKIGGDGLNGGWAASTYELVSSMTNDGTNLYAGVGNSDGDGEVYRFNGTAWTKIGGDGLNSGWLTAQGDGVYSLSYSGGELMAGLYDAGGNATYWRWNGTAWLQIGGGYVNESWGFYSLQSVESSTTWNEKLYVGTGLTVAGNAMVWEFDGSVWKIIGGQGVRGSWIQNTYENVFSLQQYNGNLYAALGTTTNDAEVWKYNGTTWTQIGGDSLNSGWAAGFEAVNVLSVYNGSLYAGLGNSANDAEVWRWNDTSWLKVGGDSLNSGWTTNYESVLSMAVYGDQLYAGLGSSTGDAEVWRYNGATWTKVGGDGLASSWNTDYEEVFVMRTFANSLVIGLGNGVDDAEVWQYNGSVWSKIGGDDINGSWTAGTYEKIRAMSVYNGELYAGIGDSTGDGEVWKFNGTAWSQIGGDNINSGWTNAIEYVSTLIDYKGKLYAGTGYSANADAAVWSIGGNAFLSSSQTSQDTNWHHIAATYNGSVMKLYIDGVENASVGSSVSVVNNNLPLNIGSTFGSGGRGEGQGYFIGKIDEVRLSNIVRSSFQTKPYSSTSQAVGLKNAVFTSGIQEYTGFLTSDSVNGGSINYRISNDNGVTWQYWNGSGWVISNSFNESNSSTDIDNNIYLFNVKFDGIKWQAIFQSNGDQRVTLNSVTIEASADNNNPSTNASNIAAYKSFGSNALTENGWTNGSSPYFSWDAGSDAGAGILGYCLYLGQDISADIKTTKGLLGNSPINPGSACQFVVDSPAVDFATTGFIGTSLTTSNSPYYLLISAIDRAGNVFPTTASFAFRFDNTPPKNPNFVSAPSGFINTKEVTLTWPTVGEQAASDGASGLAGLQYNIENTGWYGDLHDGTGSMSDLLANDGSYMTIPTPDYANTIEGTNTVSFRTWDNAGNVTVGFINAALKINTNGSPSEPLDLIVSPTNNSVNNFSFSWSAPTTYVGNASSLNYCYTVNVVPSVATCNYTGNGITSLSASSYATQPGQNTMFVVAKDEAGNINYENYTLVHFSANTSAPSIPMNIDIVDVSIKSTSKWRIAITWDTPSDTGDGVSSYKIYRSDDNVTFSVVGSSTSTTYMDSNLTQQDYYYKIVACDSTNNCSASTETVSMYPTGKYTTAAILVGQVESSNISTTKARIHWATDRNSDSKVAIGTSSGQYSSSETGNSTQLSDHIIELDNLSAGTTYYYVARWTDEDGNIGTSQEYMFTTNPAPVVKEIITENVGLSGSTVKFTSLGANSVSLQYGETEAFGGVILLNTSFVESTYKIELSDLKDGTKYYYRLCSFDSEGTEYKGNVFSFTTMPRPRIANLRFQPIAGEATSTQSVTWTTNVPSTSTINYGKIGKNGVDIMNSKLVINHETIIAGLEDDSQYYLYAESRDAAGNLAVSDRQIFKTALDSRPPKVSDVTIESSVRGSGSEAKGQVIVSWKTDEPSTSQVAYAEGSSATVFSNKSSEDSEFTTEHIVVVSNLSTSKVYSIQPMSYDKARNVGTGETQPAIIGRGNDSALTVILNTLQRIFGLK